MGMKIHVMVFWDVTLCSDINTSVSQPRRPQYLSIFSEMDLHTKNWYMTQNTWYSVTSAWRLVLQEYFYLQQVNNQGQGSMVHTLSVLF